MKAILAIALLLTASPAFAFQCPGEMAAIDAALETTELGESEVARVKELRAEGEQLHQAGQHQESVDTLAEAKAILGI
jgi:hypothetical protein